MLPSVNASVPTLVISQPIANNSQPYLWSLKPYGAPW